MQQVNASFENYAEGLWVHFSKLPQLTINPKQFHQDPAGLYLFPEKFKTEGAWHRYPYRIVCRLKPGLRVLDVPKLTHPEVMDLLEAFGFQDMQGDEYLTEDKNFRDRFWDIIRQRFMGEPGRFNKAWRRQGYDAIFDDKGIIHTAELQLIVLNPRFVEVVRVEEQKGSGFDEVNKVLDLLASKYGSLGEVTIRRPTQQKDWGEKQLRGSIEIRSGDNHATFTVQPWFVHKKDENIPETISVRLKYDSKNLTSKWSWGVDLKFRNFESELHRLTDPKEDVAKAMQQVFGDEAVSALLPVTSPEGPDFADSSDAFIGPPFGGLDFETHPMRADPEMWQHAPSGPAQQFMKDLVPLLSAFAGTPTVDEKDGQIEVEIEGKGKASGYLHGADDLSWWFDKTPEEMDDFPFSEIAILEHVEIDPKFRREGVGTELVRAFCKAAKQGGVQAVFLNASPFGSEMGGGRLTIGQITAFYRALGFKTWQDEGNSQVMWLELGKKSKSDFTREDTSGFFPEAWHDDKKKDPARLAPDPWTNTIPEAAHSAVVTELYCDLDGVLSDFDQMFLDHSGKKTSDVESPELWKTIDRIGGFWTDMDWMPDGPELWEFLKSYNPTILSAPSQSPECIPGKQQWLVQHIGEVPAIFEQKKEQYAGEGVVLIDDRESNIKKWREAGGIGILHTSAADTIRQLKELKDAPVAAGARGDWESEGGYYFKISRSDGMWSANVYHPDKKIGPEERQDTIDHYMNDGMTQQQAEEQFEESYVSPHGGLVGFLQMNTEKVPETPHVKGFPSQPGQAYHVWVDEQYRRKGLASAMYRQFERDTGIKAIPSPTVTGPGRELWEGMKRTASGAEGDWKREGYTFKLTKKINYNGAEEIYIQCFDKDGKQAGHMDANESPANPGSLYPVGVQVQPEHKRKGIASEMYRMAEEHFGMQFLPGNLQSPEGKEFRKSYDKKIKTEAVFTKKPGIGTYYHGTRSDIDRFTKPGTGKQGVGFYFTPTETEAWYFADSLQGDGNRGTPRVYEVSLKVKNPFNTMSIEDCQKVARHYGFVYKVPRFTGGASEHYQALEKQMIRHHMATKNDLNEKIAAVGFDGIYYEFMGHIIAFRPDQIKIKKMLTEYSQKPKAAVAEPTEAMNIKARVALAKATLPEGSELLQFYYMADAEGWRDQTDEQGREEWNRMTLQERQEILPTLRQHGYSDHFPKEPKTEKDWEEVMYAFLGYHEDNEQENADSTETFFEKARIMTSPTLIRFTDRPVEEVLRDGFEGYAPRNLGLTHHFRPGPGTLAFAFDKKYLRTFKEWRSMRGKYGENIFQFKVPYAVKAHHNTDGEDQVIFDVETVQNLKQIQMPQEKRQLPGRMKKGEKIPF